MGYLVFAQKGRIARIISNLFDKISELVSEQTVYLDFSG
jgi:hypothetical protein